MFGTVIVIVPDSLFAFTLASPPKPDASNSFNFTFVAIYSPFLSSFVISNLKLLYILLYPSGAFISSTNISSVPTCVISTSPKSINPLESVVFVIVFPAGIVTLNSAPLNTVLKLLASTFKICNLYFPSGFSTINFSKSSSS